MAGLSETPRFKVAEVELFERDFRLRMPFRFGVVTLTEAVQAFARIRIELPDGRTGWGVAAEALAPKWFDKDPALSNDDNVDQPRAAIEIARDFYLSAGSMTAFGLFAATYREQIRAGAERGLNPLVAGFGPALLDRAVLDALCRIEGCSFYQAMRANLPGIHADELVPELNEFDLPAFLEGLEPAPTVHARHTVGLVDWITDADRNPADKVGDGLPETLEEVVSFYGNRYFKLKVGGNVADDVARLTAIAGVLDRSGHPYRASLDGNEQYENVDGVMELWNAMCSTPALSRLVDSILFFEQPIKRSVALDRDVSTLSEQRPVIVDESDGDLNAFAIAHTRGYHGVSSKTCKGFYKSVINAARCRMWNDALGAERNFMSAEDLTTQAGVCVQQDLALINLLGITHVERNGHHYVNGMADLPRGEQDAFLAAHPDLYHRQDGVVRLKIDAGELALGSLDCTGFATGAMPDFAAMRTMPAAPAGRIGGAKA
ncbi:MAG: mandelate racemase [Rhodospirillaceae bacterium]|nr:mandelate racemase [Rhodospirillaceae bacterium]